MKILILTEGGKNIGFGHLSRCIAVSHVAREEFKKAEIDLVISGDDSAREFIKGAGEQNLKFFDWRKEVKKALAMAKEADIVLVDSYLAEKSLYDALSGACAGKIIMIDDYDRIEYPEGKVVNPSLGKDGVILRKEFWVVPDKEIKPEVKNVLVFFGGASDSGFVEKVVSELREKFEFNFNVIDAFKNKMTAKEMLEAMLASDLCISGGGQTTYELARCGLPTISVCIASNQEGNLAALEDSGFLKYAGKWDDNNIVKELAGCIERLLPYEERAKRSKIGRSLIDGKAAIEMFRSIKEKSFRLRPAMDEDCRDLWIWRNDPAVRKWCLTGGDIKYEDHEKWFKEKKDDKNVKIYILEESNTGKAGQARFDECGEDAYISVNLNPEYFGRGIGSKLIKTATSTYLEENPSIKEVIAEIKPDNIASVTAFQKAGYEYFCTANRNKAEVSVYKIGR